MKQQEIVYETTPDNYHRTTRSPDHPTIVAAKQRYAQLPFTVCSQIFKGPSYFANAEAEQFYYNSINANRLAKSQMNKSQITMDCSQYTANSSHLHQSAKPTIQKRLNSSDIMASISPINEGTENREIGSILSKSSNDQSLFKNSFHSDKQNSSLSNFYLETVSNGKLTTNQSKRYHQNQTNLCQNKQFKNQELAKNLFKPQFYNEVPEVVSENESDQQNGNKDQKSQIERLRKLLQQKDKQIANYKQQLNEANKAKLAQKTSTGDSNKKQIQNVHKMDQMRKQLGGTVPGLMYMTLFMVLLTKHVMH